MSYSSNSINPPKIDKDRILKVCKVPEIKTNLKFQKFTNQQYI